MAANVSEEAFSFLLRVFFYNLMQRYLLLTHFVSKCFNAAGHVCPFRLKKYKD